MTRREPKHRCKARETADERSRRHVQLDDRPCEYSISANVDETSPLVRSQRRQKSSNSRAKRPSSNPITYKEKSTESTAYSYAPKDEFALLKERVVKPNCTRKSYGLAEEVSIGRLSSDNKVADVNPLVIMDELELLEHGYVDKTGRRKLNKYPELDDIPVKETSDNSSCCKSVRSRASGSKGRRRRRSRQGKFLHEQAAHRAVRSSVPHVRFTASRIGSIKDTFNGEDSVGRMASKGNGYAISPCSSIGCRSPVGSCAAPRRNKNVLGSVVFVVGMEGERRGVLSYKVSEDSRIYTLVNVVDDCKAMTNEDESPPQQKQEITLEFGDQRSFLIVKNTPLGKNKVAEKAEMNLTAKKKKHKSCLLCKNWGYCKVRPP